jgi:two-component system cell cycle sensor histidine kinase/response regulator CckA
VLTATKPGVATMPLHVLLVGQREEDFFLIREILGRAKSTLFAELDHANSLEQAKTMLQQQSYDLILFEYENGDAAAVRLLSDFVQAGITIPFLLLTEHADENTVAGILQEGNWNFVEKSQLNGPSLVRTIRGTLALHSMQLKQQSAEKSLRNLSRAVEQSADTVVITDRDGVIEYVNPAFENLTGYLREELIGKTHRVLNSGQQDAGVFKELWETILSGNVYRSILINRKKNGKIYSVEENISPVRNAEGCITHFISNGRDLTERLRLEAQLLQSQKMDAVGRLAGGVAHDFKKLLTIITSYSELALDAVTTGSPMECKLQEILSAARRAAQLTRQLLAFSRKQPQALRVVEFNKVVADIARTLPRLIGEDIEVTLTTGEGLGKVRIDPVQLEQILMNLAANGRDAMPQGGQIKIETQNAYLDENYIQLKQAIIPIGRYALLTVTDSGIGIPADHLPHIFEPFYTTKPSGQGTGLGLATVYGIVKQNRGFIWAYSEVGRGTIFKVYLPCVEVRERANDAVSGTPQAVANGSETVLLVEDEKAVRRAISEFLSLHGYTVLEAGDGMAALAVARNHGSPIHLVVTDVVMPNLSGGQLARALIGISPKTKVLFVSGYAGKTVMDHDVLDLETNFLQKPFTLKQLSGKIREVLSSNAVKEQLVS